MKRLLRSRRDRVIFGVAGGIADYFEVDPTLVRLAWVAAGLSGFGVVLYIIAALIVPENPQEYSAPVQPPAQPADDVAPAPVSSPASSTGTGSRSFGYVLVALGLFMLIRRFVPWFNLDRLWPVVLILIGAYMVTGGARSGK